MPFKIQYGFYSRHPSQELSLASGEMIKFNKRMAKSEKLDENDDDTERTWITKQIKESVWKMLKSMRSHETKESKNEIFLSNAMQRKYFRTT